MLSLSSFPDVLHLLLLTGRIETGAILARSLAEARLLNLSEEPRTSRSLPRPLSILIAPGLSFPNPLKMSELVSTLYTSYANALSRLQLKSAANFYANLATQVGEGQVPPPSPLSLI